MIKNIKKFFAKKKLTEEFHNEHAKLYEIYLKIIEAADYENVNFLTKNFNEFIQGLTAHLQKEDELLYKIIEDNFEKRNPDITIQNYINEIKKEMEKITSKFERFLKKYQNINKNNIKNFKNEFVYIMSIIIKRIQLEENILYRYFDSYIDNK